MCQYNKRIVFPKENSFIKQNVSVKNLIHDLNKKFKLKLKKKNNIKGLPLF